ncbi:ABC transporter ATP-binding protein [Actinomadura sp. WMMB 499]|uniref:ABC transporter ATP-binding protein n=1 Tax=Actinomadura sp. WMMB 499 TaxID=1219491 RepID=UPI0012441282|nr:ABC transporter ATP-binding protein [Actinomadura sp. WMMB 499]QFG22168.1 ABC transporter ATP-binding protein [Actinomadura sp. WMMB 499]
MDGSPRGPSLAVQELEVAYHRAVRGLRGVSVKVPAGGVVALLGANGAGKTTLLRAVTGLLDGHGGVVTAGTAKFGDLDLRTAGATRIVRAGLTQVMEGRRVFAELTVEENLRTGAYTRRDKAGVRASHERVMALFPRLAERRGQVAGYLSGGEQQMLAIGRALMGDPKLLVLDEPSLGLAPMVVEQIRQIIKTINGQGTSVLLVEQNARMALSIADHGYVLETGRIVREGPAAELAADARIQEFYLGGAAGRPPLGRAPHRRKVRR